MAYNNSYRGHSTTIFVEDNNVERAINRLRMLSSQFLKELKDRRYFEKKCDKRRRKQKESQRRASKSRRMMNDF